MVDNGKPQRLGHWGDRPRDDAIDITRTVVITETESESRYITDKSFY